MMTTQLSHEHRTIYLDRRHPAVRDILTLAFPNYTGNRVTVETAGSVRFSGTMWSDGYRDSYCIVRYDGQTGEYVDALGIDAELAGPSGLEFGPDGYLYVTAFHRDAVMRFDVASGDLIDVFIDDVSLSGPTAVAFIPEPATLWLFTLGGLILVRRRR